MRYTLRRWLLLFIVCGLLFNGIVSAQGMPGQVNINTADEAALTTLPNIGSAKAKAIVTYRTQHGPFKSVDDLSKVPGVGNKTVQTLRDKITVGTSTQ